MLFDNTLWSLMVMRFVWFHFFAKFLLYYQFLDPDFLTKTSLFSHFHLLVIRKKECSLRSMIFLDLG